MSTPKPGDPATARAGDERVTVVVNRSVYEGWKTVSITRSIEAIAGKFEVTFSDRWSPDAEPWPILPGDHVEVFIGKDKVIHGNVDEASPSFSAESHELTVRGRDKTADLVDTSLELSPDQFKGLKLDALVRKFIEPYSLELRVQVDVGEPFDTFKVQPGEAPFEAISRACRSRAILPTSDEEGRLVLTRAGKAKASEALIQGENILSASGVFDHSDRFSRYRVKGQERGTDDFSGKDAGQVFAESFDSSVKRFRPLVIIAGGTPEPKAIRDRAKWEASVRAGRSSRIDVTVQGFRQRDRTLWRENSETRVVSPFLRVDEELLISGLTMRLGQGRTTSLQLVRKDAFALLPEPEVPSEGDPESTGA